MADYSNHAKDVSCSYFAVTKRSFRANLQYANHKNASGFGSYDFQWLQLSAFKP
jgi:hypothetical protein